MKPMPAKTIAKLRKAHDELKTLLETGKINNGEGRKRGIEICEIILNHYCTIGERHE